MKIEVANGEIVDKLTILKIKLENSDSPEKTEQILKELEYLRPIVEGLDVPQEMIDELQTVNQKIWDTEDSIRLCEKNKQFDETFVQLARDVYYNNDDRFEVKKKINQKTNSYINEQKILPNYN
jgi:hypothetical protein